MQTLRRVINCDGRILKVLTFQSYQDTRTVFSSYNSDKSAYGGVFWESGAVIVGVDYL